ncbi:hypothetical protein TSUD_235250 [Trifolium subterraneum]|uniref:AAA+ ATPase domain-containing protein n=1 Tax=Trifolium subterraneum TaxID=3900 RepID=A0A2Z6NF77_TRISU|nr:hypothetical protein TSUD_235250 [Trifolium subterraneum]
MADSSVSFLLDKLSSLLQEEVNLQKGVREDVQYIKDELERHKAILMVADSLEHKDPELQVWVKSVRNIAQDMEDAIDEYNLRLVDHHQQSQSNFSIHKIAFGIKTMKARHRIATDIQGIKSKVETISNGRPNITGVGSSSSQRRSSRLDSQGDALLLEEADLVGIEEPKKQLCDLLFKDETNRAVISIYGMGGLGKTTLAKQVYEDPKVKKYFRIHAWVNLSQSFRMEEVLKDLVQQLHNVIGKPAPESIGMMKIENLKEFIKNFLQRSKKYLIVLDDVWHVNVWDAVKLALPNNNCGSRVILTTRKKDIALYSCAELGKDFHLEFLPKQEAWSLFCRKTFQGNSCPPHLEEVCRKILKLCGGLPLAIVAISGALATKERSNIEEWNMVCRSFGSEIEGNDILESRDQNFATIAKDNDMVWPERVRRLSVINSSQNVFQQNKTTFRLRSMLMFPSSDSPNHFSMHELCTSSGVKLLNVLDLQDAPLEVFPAEIVSLYLLKYLSLKNTKVKNIPGSIKKLQYLETLDLKHTYVTELPAEIAELKRLRHLLVYRYEIESYAHFHSRHGFNVAAPIGNMLSLQKLCFIEVDQGSGALMVELGKLTQLRRLGIRKMRKEDGAALCSAIEKMVNLTSLSITAITEDEIIDIHSISKPPRYLQKLYLSGRLEKFPQWIKSCKNLVRVFLKWSRLKEDPLMYLQDLPNLRHLEFLKVYVGETLQFNAKGFPSLKMLGLDDLEGLKYMIIEEEAMQGLKKLVIQQCGSFKNVPLGIEHLTKLKAIELFDMPKELIMALRPNEGEDYWRVQNVPAIYSTYWRDHGWDVYPINTFGEIESDIDHSIALRTLQLPTLSKVKIIGEYRMFQQFILLIGGIMVGMFIQ